MSNNEEENVEGFRGGRGGRLFGGVGVGAGVVCDSKDNSMYCSFIKFVTVIIYTAVLFFLFYWVYGFLKTTKIGRRIFGGR